MTDKIKGSVLGNSYRKLAERWAADAVDMAERAGAARAAAGLYCDDELNSCDNALGAAYEQVSDACAGVALAFKRMARRHDKLEQEGGDE